MQRELFRIPTVLNHVLIQLCGEIILPKISYMHSPDQVIIVRDDIPHTSDKYNIPEIIPSSP